MSFARDLHSTPRPSVMDTIDERYAQYRHSAQQFPLVQFGLSAFYWDADARVFCVETFQFPLFPVFHDQGSVPNRAASVCPDRRFLIQAKCLQYIRAHGFDLNAWIDQGIGHLSHYEQQQEPCKSALAQPAGPEVSQELNSTTPALITDETQKFLDRIMMKVKQRLAAYQNGIREETAGRGGTAQDRVLQRRKRRKGRKDEKEKGERTKWCGGDNEDACLTSSAGKDALLDVGVALKDQDGDVLDTGDGKESVQHEVDAEVAQAKETVMNENVVARMKQFLMAPVPNDPTNGPCGAFVTEPLAPFRRHALVQHLCKIFPGTLAVDCRVDNIGNDDVVQKPWKRRVRIIDPRCKSQRCALLLANQQLADDERRERNLSLIGFTAVLDIIVAAQKSIVGHNLLLDLMQCYDKFHGPLPGRCAEFQRELHAWLGAGGGVFDTKTLVDYAMQKVDSFGAHLTHTALENCFEVLSKHPFYGPDVQCVQSLREDAVRKPLDSFQSPLQAHQAGYDAFMTGFVFLRVCSGLGISNERIASLGKPSQGFTEHMNDTLASLRNVLFVSHFLPTCVLTLPGPYPQPTLTPSRSRFVRMKLSRTRVPTALATLPLPTTTSRSALKTFHIKHCVGWVLNLQSATKLINVYWEGQDCVYVELPSAEAVEQLLALRAQTKECWGSTNDPMPSIGCVDLDRCPATYDCAEIEARTIILAPPLAAQQSTTGDEKSRRKRKSCEMAP